MTWIPSFLHLRNNMSARDGDSAGLPLGQRFASSSGAALPQPQARARVDSRPRHHAHSPLRDSRFAAHILFGRM